MLLLSGDALEDILKDEIEFSEYFEFYVSSETCISELLEKVCLAATK